MTTGAEKTNIPKKIPALALCTCTQHRVVNGAAPATVRVDRGRPEVDVSVVQWQQVELYVGN